MSTNLEFPNAREKLFVAKLAQRSAMWSHRLLTTDFFPQWNNLVYRIKTPLAILILTSLVSLFCGFFVAPQGYILFAASLSVIAVGIAYPWFAVRGVTCQVKFPNQRATESQTIHPSLVILNKWPMPVSGLAVQRGFLCVGRDTSDVDDTAVALAHIPGWSKTDFRWGFTPFHRGVYPKRPTMLTCAFPFGIWTARRRVEVSGNLVVNPVSLDLKPNRCENFTLVQSRKLVAASGMEMDPMGIRRYRNGDVLRDVHWSATARHDRLMVKERQSTRSDHVHIVLDLRPVKPSSIDALSTSLDWAARITAGLCDAYLKLQIPVTLDIGRKRVLIRDSKDQAVALESLAIAQLEPAAENEVDEHQLAFANTQMRIAPQPASQHRPGTIEIASKIANASKNRIVVNLPHSTAHTLPDFEQNCQVVVDQITNRVRSQTVSGQEPVYA